MRSARSWHFVPAHRAEYFRKAFATAADVLVFDLEDAVPAGEKEAARSRLEDELARRSAADRARAWIRVNSGAAEFRRDLRLIRRIRPAGVVVPKVETARSLRSSMAAVDRAAGAAGKSIALVESFQAASRLQAILEGWPVSGVGLGLEDMFSDTDLLPEEASELARHVRLTLVIEARARGILAVDSVSLEYRDRARLSRRCAASRRLGFDGMFTIHPRQIVAVNAAFSPRRRDIVWATKIARLTALEEGAGYANRGGEVISPPKVRKARRILGQGPAPRRP